MYLNLRQASSVRAYRFTDFVLKGIPERIENGEISAAITMVGIKISISLINAAAVSV